ncbi:GtrA family protein [Modestobacter sp. VKM Ac-2983]|uniref:GtrA family protein n=1 Tax=Modestobacter sp. VKM Ac-2983 TaxID=3004137 RepID=UPI0022ABAFC3|nr:GtrA family protein [Modestobacter sp. VKM Ac-2983]MCZ2806466.1 GtrA family protein [Modestobacter sp. VKM Ac-2983]
MRSSGVAGRGPAAVRRRLVKELGAFGVVGFACFVLDVGLFQVLYAHLGTGAVTAKLLSTLVSMSVAFVAHRYWSFSHRAHTGVRREYLVFAMVNGLTLLLSLGVVAAVRYPLGQTEPLVLQVANIGSIAVGTVIRFLSYRRWVFLAPDHPAAVPTPAATPTRR